MPPSRASRRATDALRPSPAPMIRAVSYRVNHRALLRCAAGTGASMAFLTVQSSSKEWRGCSRSMGPVREAQAARGGRPSAGLGGRAAGPPRRPDGEAIGAAWQAGVTRARRRTEEPGAGSCASAAPAAAPTFPGGARRRGGDPGPRRGRWEQMADGGPSAPSRRAGVARRRGRHPEPAPARPAADRCRPWRGPPAPGPRPGAAGDPRLAAVDRDDEDARSRARTSRTKPNGSLCDDPDAWLAQMPVVEADPAKEAERRRLLAKVAHPGLRG